MTEEDRTWNDDQFKRKRRKIGRVMISAKQEI